jgi:ABC-type branched-subunit amino acid transport system substrate-binding protein
MAGATGAVYKLVSDSLLTYIKYVNAEKGGVCGREIVIKREDDGGDYGKALEVTRKLVEEENVLAMVSALGPNDAAAEYLAENHVPDMMEFGGPKKFTDLTKYPLLSNATATWYIEGKNFAYYIKETFPGKKVGLLYQNAEAGKEEREALEEFLDPSNPLVDAEPFETTAIDVRSQVLKLKEAGTEVLVLASSLATTAQALKQVERLDWDPAVMMNYTNSDPLLFTYAPAEVLEGAISFQAFKMPDWTDDPAVAEHVGIMARYGGPGPSTFTILMQTIGEVLVETLSRTCDDLTREGVNKAFESFQCDPGWPSLIYPGTCINTSATDHFLFAQANMQQVVLENGKAVWKDTGRLMDFEKGGFITVP